MTDATGSKDLKPEDFNTEAMREDRSTTTETTEAMPEEIEETLPEDRQDEGEADSDESDMEGMSDEDDDFIDEYGVKGSGENADKDGEVPASLVEASLPDEHKEHYNNYMDQAHNAYADYMEKYFTDVSAEDVDKYPYGEVPASLIEGAEEAYGEESEEAGEYDHEGYPYPEYAYPHYDPQAHHADPAHAQSAHHAQPHYDPQAYAQFAHYQQAAHAEPDQFQQQAYAHPAQFANLAHHDPQGHH